MRQRLLFSQWDSLDEAVDSGRGVIIVTMHFGIWDLGAAALAAYDYPINAIAERFSYSKMNELIHGSRERLGMKVIPMDRVGPGVFRALKRGEILAMLSATPQPGGALTSDPAVAPAGASSAPAPLRPLPRAGGVPRTALVPFSCSAGGGGERLVSYFWYLAGYIQPTVRARNPWAQEAPSCPPSNTSKASTRRRRRAEAGQTTAGAPRKRGNDRGGTLWGSLLPERAQLAPGEAYGDAPGGLSPWYSDV